MSKKSFLLILLAGRVKTISMPVLKNQRHEKFAQRIAKGDAATKAYIAAGFSPKAAKQNASRLRENEVIGERIAELQASAAKRVEWSIAERLKFFREAAEIPPAKITLKHRVCQGMRKTKFGNYLLVPDKLKAAVEYGRLAGDYDRDAEVEANGVTVRVRIGGNAQ